MMMSTLKSQPQMSTANQELKKVSESNSGVRLLGKGATLNKLMIPSSHQLFQRPLTLLLHRGRLRTILGEILSAERQAN
jgi:hypothetical protein